MNMALCCLRFLILFTPFVMSDIIPKSNVLVQTNSGPVVGTIETGYLNKRVRAFMGIPYAEPPIGKLRFKPPVPVSPWTDVFDATQPRLPCYQTYTKVMRDLFRKLEREVRRPWSEDCLTLNIWTPEEVPSEVPIVMFFHEGGFNTGTGTPPYFEFSTLSVEMHTVAVSFNYRVGAFGFLSLGTSEVPGNLGLMDQHLALRWIRNNAEAFGGNRDAIFLFGFAAGGASVGHQVILEQNAGLFKTAVVSAGSPICPGAWQTRAKAVSLGRSLARSLGCLNDSMEPELDCLQNVHPEDIVDASVLENTHVGLPFKPNLDGTFIKESPIEAMKAGRFNNVTFLVINARSELAVFFYSLNKDILTEEEGLTSDGFIEAVKRVGLAQTETDLEAIRKWYLRNSSMDSTEIRNQAVHAYSDALKICCTSKFADYAVEGGVLVFRSIVTLLDARFPAWMGSHSLVNILMLVGDPLNPKRNSSAEDKESSLLVMMVSGIYSKRKAKDFAEAFPLYNLQDRWYTDWGLTQQILKQYRTEECELWNSILPKIRSRRHQCH